MADSKSSDVLYGVDCGVANCKYHGHDNRCFAENISVGTQNTASSATKKSETFCGTFSARPTGL